MSGAQYTTMMEFYPYYLSQHSNPINRALHIFGSTLNFMLTMYVIFAGYWYFVPLTLLSDYPFAWFGHFYFERNKPATFSFPVWSFFCDWIMWYETLTLQRGLSDISVKSKKK